MKKKIISLIFLLSGSIAASAQAEYTLPSYTTISSNSINCIAEDSDGYIWLGTNAGANRYNGSIYKRYTSELSHSSVTSILPDKDGKIWTGSYSGINLIRNGEVDHSARIPTSMVYHLAHFDGDKILFSGRKSLNLLDKRSLTTRKVYEDERVTYNDFFVAKDNHIWLNQLIEPAFIILDSSFKEVREVRFDGHIITDAVPAKNGEVLILTNKGIFRYDSSGNKLPPPDALEEFTKGKYILFYEERPEENAAWIGIRDMGIFRKDHESGIFTQIWDREILSNVNETKTLTTGNGLYFSPDGYGLKHLSISSLNASFPVPKDDNRGESLNMFYDLGDNSLLILTNKDIYRYNRDTRVSTKLDAEGISGNTQINISAISKNSHLWLVYGLTELREYEFNGDRLRLVSRHSIKPTTSIWTRPDGSVQLLQDSEILSFHNNGAVTKQVVDCHALDFWYCGQTVSGKPFMQTSDDIYIFDILSGELQRLDVNIPSPSALYEDNDGIMWIGSKANGVFRYDPVTKVLTNIGIGQGLSDLSIRSIIGDIYGNIWVSTPTKVSRIDSEQHVIMFNAPSEITKAFSTNSALALSDGHVLFGSMFRIADYHHINPGEREEFALELDGVVINGMREMDIQDRIVLNHNQNTISLYFSAKNFDPDIIPNIEYKLEGYDKEWVPSGGGFRAGYTNIKPGTYSFKIRVYETTGALTEKVLIPKIKAKPHPLLSWPAFTIYIILLLFAFYLAAKWYISDRLAHSKLEMAEQEKLLNEQIAQERMDFFSNVSHEFRTPLELIYGPIKDLSENGVFDNKEKKLISIIERNAERMIKLTDQLLTFNRERDLQRLSVMHTDISLLLRYMIENFSYAAKNKNLIINQDIPEQMIVYCDREKVEKIFFNLLSNAIKYTPEDGNILIRCRKEGDMLSISVEDTGTGIAPEMLGRIFNRYERLRQTVGDKVPSGFGIGLNYAYNLALAHRGKLQIGPNKPEGTIATFTFPCDEQSYDSDIIWNLNTQESPAEEEPVWPLENTKKFHILIAEDNPDMRSYIKSILGKDFSVTLACDGEEAMKSVRTIAPDLIISDIIMPYKDGYTLCKELKDDNEYCHIPIILLTAKVDMESRLHGLDLGADAYISKPFESGILLATIRGLIQNRLRMQHILGERTFSTTDTEVHEDEDIKPRDKAFVEKMYKIIDEHLSDESFGVTQLASELGMSRTSVFSKIKSLLGLSPQAFLNNYRLNKAMELLKTHEMNISEVAYKVGFSTLTGFSRSFKNKFGVPPSAI